MPDPSPPGSRQTRDRHLPGACASGATDPPLQSVSCESCTSCAVSVPPRHPDAKTRTKVPLVLALGRRIIRHPICKAARPGPCSAWPPLPGSTLSTRCLGRTSPDRDIAVAVSGCPFCFICAHLPAPWGRRAPSRGPLLKRCSALILTMPLPPRLFPSHHTPVPHARCCH